jgi:hypothetical protein
MPRVVAKRQNLGGRWARIGDVLRDGEDGVKRVLSHNATFSRRLQVMTLCFAVGRTCDGDVDPGKT